MATIEPGETIRFDCPGCGAEWEVTYEPKAQDGAMKAGLRPARLRFCPGCAEGVYVEGDGLEDAE